MLKKGGLLLKSHLISESQMEKSKMNVPRRLGICRNNKRMSVCSDVVCKERRGGVLSVTFHEIQILYMYFGVLGGKCASVQTVA